MRALVIGHAYVAEDNRAKWQHLALSKQAEIELHLPHQWPSWETHYRPSPHDSNGFRIKTSNAFRTGREDQYFFAPNIFHGLKTGDFDILHVEQGAGACVYSQALFERNLVSPKTKSCFFTWINWEYSLRWPWTFLEPFNLRYSTGAIGGNSEAVDLLKKHGFRGKTAVIPQLGVDPQEYHPSKNHTLRKQLNTRELVIGFVGRLVPEKGILLLLEAAVRMGDQVTILILGSGPLEAEILRFQKEHPVHLIHVPAVSHHQVADYLRAMDILVLPSYATPTWKEQFGHVLIEAMSCEIPVIGSSSAAIPEVIADAGLIFQEKNVEDLTKNLQLLGHSPSERLRLGQLGRQRVLKHYTHEEIARQTLEFWKTL